MKRDERRYPSRGKVQRACAANHREQLHWERPPAEGIALHGLPQDTYVLRTCIPWQDLPAEIGEWHTVYNQFNRGNARGLWNKALVTLQNEAGLSSEVIIDGTTVKVHRRGGGQKRGIRAKGRPARG